jgi:cytochrome c oxidase subunit II
MKRMFSVSYFLLAAGLILAACRGLGQNIRPIQSPPGGSVMPRATLVPAADPGNGEQIYFTASDKNGDRIRYTGGPNFGGMMMGAYLTCAACHGPDAHGGQHVMHMQTMDAPPVYAAALTNMLAEESGGTQQPGGYILDDFRKSVVDGKHPDGDALDNDMPRWQMTDQDLADLFAFLKTIPQ